MSEPADEVMDLIFGRWRSQTLYTGAKLGVFEAVAEAPHSAREVAEAQDLDPENTYRLMRALASIGLLDEHSDGRFEVTEAGELLTKQHPRSLRGVALLEGGPEAYAAWRHLPELIRSGEEEAFEKEHGCSLFELVEADSDYAQVFNEAMTSGSRMQAETVLEAIPEGRLTDLDHLCDVGGGQGYLLSRLLEAYPHLSGEVLELPDVVEGGRGAAEEMGVADRLAFTTGDMFESVPEADGYFLKFVLHDWDDGECVEILETIRAAADPGAPVFVAELVVPGPDTPHFAKLSDLNMLIMTGGRERTVEEYGELLDRSGVELADHHEVAKAPLSVVEGRVA